MPQDKNHFEGWDRLHLSKYEAADLAGWLLRHLISEGTEHQGPHASEGYVVAQSAQSGVGITTFVKCLECGEEKDITDYGIW